MRILYINTGNDGSTGMIIKSIARAAQKRGFCTVQAYPCGSTDLPIEKEDYVICSLRKRLITRELTYLTGLEGCFSIISTYKLIKRIEKFNPDIIHLNNIHGWYLNFHMLFSFIKKKNIPIVWTLHDCWAFTGHCPHFQKTHCEKWKSGCYSCPQHLDYPKSYLDNSKFMYRQKKKFFLDVKSLVTVTPSNWLSSLVKSSFMSAYPSKTIYNGIDLNLFKPRASELRKELNCMNKFVVLGVAASWTLAKGADAFIELAKILDNEYQIVLVGATNAVCKDLPDNIISVGRIDDTTKLSMFYSMADVFVNPTREDVLGLVNIESLACGTPVITYETGGCPECIDESCGVSVKKGDVFGLSKEIVRVCKNKIYSAENCRKRAECFSKEMMYQSYLDLYENLSKSSVQGVGRGERQHD